MMEAAEENKTTTAASVTVNVGYPKSFQGVLKIVKCAFLFACLVCSAILVNGFNRTAYGYYISSDYLNYALAASVIGFVAELVIFILYMAGVNQRWSTNAVCGILMLIYHIVMLIMMYAACIVMTAGGGYRAAQAYVAFGILTIMGFSLDIYLNIVWIRGGPELAALSVPGA